MRQVLHRISIRTKGAGLTDITRDIARFVADAGLETALLTVLCRHTSASLLIQENADPDVQRDLVAFFHRLVPDGDPLFVHVCEGPDDMPAHVKAALTQTQLSIPISDGAMVLGTWQGIYVFEHRHRPHEREIALHIIGE